MAFSESLGESIILYEQQDGYSEQQLVELDHVPYSVQLSDDIQVSWQCVIRHRGTGSTQLSLWVAHPGWSQSGTNAGSAFMIFFLYFVVTTANHTSVSVELSRVSS